MRSTTKFTESELAEFFVFLDQLRESGVINMFGASPFITDRFDMPLRDAPSVLALWTKTFSHDAGPFLRAERAREIQEAA